MKPYKILFVCTGNICRSPTAEGVFRHKLREAGLESAVAVDSAGTHNYHEGDLPDPRAIEVAAKRGYDLRDLRARKVRQDDFERFDLLLAMDRSHLRTLHNLTTDTLKSRVKLFLEHAGHDSILDVPDPYYGSMNNFIEVIELIEDSSNMILKKLRSELGEG